MGGKASAFESAVGLERVQRIFTAGGSKPATQAGGTENGSEHGGDQRAIGAHQKDQNISSRIHSVSVSSLARRSPAR